MFHNCNSLKSLYFKADPSVVSLKELSRCRHLVTIKAPSFSTTTFNSRSGVFGKVLIGANYTHLNLRNLHQGNDLRSGCEIHIYYSLKVWSRTKCTDGRSLLCAAAVRCLAWYDVTHIFAANMPAIYEADALTGLPLFMLAAVGPNSDLESTYNLLRKYPPAIMSV